jgi:(+)-trans-carveol dehydrogenase
MGRVRGKVALITGGARGQGRSHAVTLAREGAQIVVTDLLEPVSTVPYDMPTQDDLDETVRLVEALDQRCLAVKADASSSAEMKAVADMAIAEFGHIDILCANAGVFTVGAATDLSDEAWDQTIAADLSGVWRSCRAVIPHMIEQNSGSIILTSSGAGTNSARGLGAYVAAKHGVIGVMRTLAAELGSNWIRVNALCPTMVATPMIHNPAIAALFAGGRSDATNEDMAFPAEAMNVLPIKWLDAQDISNAVLFFASDESRYVTGFPMPVDAGYMVQPPGIPLIAANLIDQLTAERAAE